MTTEERAGIQTTLGEMLKNARGCIAMSERYEDDAKSYLVAAQYVLKSAGIEKTSAELRAMLARRENVFVAEDYAALALRELFGEAETEPTEAAEA